MVCSEGHRREYWIDRESREAPCSSCSAIATRVISPVSTVFKGSGWPDKDHSWAKKHEYHGDIAKARRGEPVG
jgi:predicted nucleic acid-binding Zn ribbon protein